MISYQQFEDVDIRVGKIIDVQDFPEARKPAFKLTIDFGSEVGVKKSSAQLPTNYTKQELQGKLVMAVVNFEPRQIDPFMSEVLTLGIPDGNGGCMLVVPDKDVPIGGSLY